MLLAENRPQIVRKFFETLRTFLGVKDLTTTAYHPQANGQAERYNKIIVPRLRHHVAEHQRNWDLFVQPLTYAYNTQVPHPTGMTSLVLYFHTNHPDYYISYIDGTAS